MRLSSFLPMLLLLASPLAAQPNCSIFDLTATVVQFDPNTCQFFVVLNFGHSGTTNQFVVTGNGTNYGTFDYSQDPLTLGPFTSTPNGPHVLEFHVQDAVFQDCFDAVSVDIPPCNTTAGCLISNLTVDIGDCHPLTGTYTINLNFDAANAGNGTFDVWAGNNIHLGTFSLADLPLKITDFPWGGGASDVVKVCITGQPNCCAALDFLSPNCFTPGCGLLNLLVNVGDCTSDTTFKALINFDLVSIVGADSFRVYLDGSIQGTFALNQLPLPISFHTTGNPHAVVKVCIDLPLGLPCCLEKEITEPLCLPPCKIQDLTIQTDSCTTDSTFGVWVNFHVADSTAVDSFAVWGNGGVSLGHFGLNQLPLHLPDFKWNGLVFNHIRICTGDDPGCCREVQFLAPDCLPFGDCHVTNIFVQTGACTSDSTYKVLLNFNATNPGNGTFIVSANGTVLDTFNLSDAPLMIPNFPWNGGANDIVTVCIGGTTPGAAPCCESKEFPVPACLGTCDIVDLTVVPGDCDPNSNTFPITINFHVAHPGNDSFEVRSGGVSLGIFALSQLPLTIPNFQSNGAATTGIRVCIIDHPNCCAEAVFQTPNCTGACHIFDLSIQVGDCNPAGGYGVTINFGVNNPGNDNFSVWANGQFFGSYPLNQLPLHIPNFPGSGNAIDLIRICINDHPDCCVEHTIQAPNCNPTCHLFDLTVVVGDCNPNGGYGVTINFGVTNPGNDFFDVFANGQHFGTYPLNQLPLFIPNFPASGNAVDILRICINDHPNCCESHDIIAPHCDNCEIVNLHVETGACNQDSTYHLTLNFGVVNSTDTTFAVWGNGILIGTFNLSQLPLHIPNFPWDGTGPNDFLKVCMGGVTSTSPCCKTIEFPIPACLLGGNCDITNLHVETGACTGDSTYQLTFNFQATNPLGNLFGVWANGQFLGMYGLGQLPITIQNFPWNGGNNDVLRVCFGTNPGGLGTCCEQIEFPVPGCLLNNGNCEIFNMVVDPGDCTSDSTYNLHLNFQVSNPPGDIFAVWANGVPFGTFNLNQLPLILHDFPWNGGANDVIKVCFVTANGTIGGCCKTVEFPVPACLGNSGNCEIVGLVVDPGACTSDSSYSLFLNFQAVNPPSSNFGVWANGVFLGTFNLGQLPLNFPNFPWNGGPNDVVKVCFVTAAGVQTCCKSLEFPVPDCLNNGGNCHISDVYAVHTGCLCGQFFVAITFNHVNGSAAGFDIVGNGNNYGTFPYSMHQPIILGPFPGDGTTSYEFGVVDHNHPDCHDAYQLGTVDCSTPVHEPSNMSSLVISPNPASGWINVTAMLGSGTDIGQATVKVYHADGRLLQTQTVANAASFQLDISNLPSGVYRLSIEAGAGHLNGSFTKQ